jgi:hypothetical protein
VGAAIGIGVVSFLVFFTISVVLGARAATAVVAEPEAMFPTPPARRRKA